MIMIYYMYDKIRSMPCSAGPSCPLKISYRYSNIIQIYLLYVDISLWYIICMIKSRACPAQLGRLVPWKYYRYSNIIKIYLLYVDISLWYIICMIRSGACPAHLSCFVPWTNCNEKQPCILTWLLVAWALGSFLFSKNYLSHLWKPN